MFKNTHAFLRNSPIGRHMDTHNLAWAAHGGQRRVRALWPGSPGGPLTPAVPLRPWPRHKLNTQCPLFSSTLTCVRTRTPPHQASPPSVFPWVPNPACMTPEGYCLSPNNDFMGSRQQGKQEGLFLLFCKVLRLQKLWHLSISSLPEATSEVWTSQLYCIFLSCHLTPIPRHRFLSIFTGS